MANFYGQYVGFGSGGVAEPFGFQGLNYGYTYGGYGCCGTGTPSSDVNKFSLSSDGDGTDVGDQAQRTEAYTGSSSKTDGYQHGGNYWPTTGPTGYWSAHISKFSFAASDGWTMSNIGSLTVGRGYVVGHTSDGYGWTSGGWNGSLFNTIDRFSHTSDGDASDWEDLEETKNQAAGSNSSDHGYVHGHRIGVGSDSNVISRFPFASATTASDVGDLAVAKRQQGGCSSTTHGYATGGGEGPTAVNHVQKYAFAASSDASDIGNLLSNVWNPASNSSTTAAYTSGGSSDDGSTSLNTIQKNVYSSDGDSSDVGNLSRANAYMGLGSQY